MTTPDTPPDVNGLINLLNALAIDFECDDKHDAKETCDKAAAALRTLQEENEALNEECDASMETIALERARAEAAEARVKELEAERDEARESVKRQREWLGDAQHRAGEMLGRAKKAEAKLAEAMKALGMMLKEHDILSGNFGDVMDPKHKRPDRWPTAAEAARRALKENGNG